MKNVVFSVVTVVGIAAGFFAGRMCAGVSCPAKGTCSSAPDGALAGAEKRIAALEAELAAAKADAQRARKLASRAEKAVSKAVKGSDEERMASFTLGTNTDVIAEMRKQLPEKEFVAATNALERMKVANAERAKGRREYLASIDVNGLSAKERENHARFMELFDRREKAMAKMKGIIPDEKTLGELVEIEMQMQPLAKQERKALLGAMTRELGYTGEDGTVVMDTIDGIFDCTSAGGLGGLADIGGLMEATGAQPSVSVETHVIGL